LEGVLEYNEWGFAANNSKYRISDEEALNLYGFYATWLGNS